MKEETLTREDRFHSQFYEAIIKELKEIKALLKEEQKDESESDHNPRRKR